MLYYAVLFISFFLIAFILRIYRSVFHSLARKSLAVLNGLFAELDEDEKIRQMQGSTTSLLIALLKVLGLIILAFVIGFMPLLIFSHFSNGPFSSLDFTSLTAILVLSAGATLAFIVPLGKKDRSSYSELARLLHRMALDNYHLGYRLFRQEVKKVRKRGVERREDFVIISGLARAGTTSLMNALANIGPFVSLSYANMPFLLSPDTWAKIYKPKADKLKERSHKDGIMIGYDSNEALEEYFFKVKANDGYIGEDYLQEYELSEKDYSDYLDYQCIIRKESVKRYLAKNNNFMLRYRSMRSFNEDFLMVILYRDPLTHASSLMEKHRDYLRLQEEDPFVLEYMNWLGHHEFGKGQKPFLFRDSKLPDETDRDKVDYWLQLWIAFYKHALNIDHPNTLFIRYEDFCEHPEAVVSHILSKARIEASVPGLQAFRNRRKVLSGYSEELYREAMEVFDALKRK